MRATRLHSRFVAQVGAVAAVLLVLSAEGTASAEPTYPGFLQQKLNSKCLVQCTMCHPTLEGGQNKLSDLDNGVLPDLGGNRGQGEFFANLVHVNGSKYPIGETQLLNFIDKLETKPCDGVMGDPPCDSDGDGTPDVAELRADREPDRADPGSTGECHMPQYGCGASIGTLPRESSAAGRAATLMALLGAGLVLARRARRA